MAKVNARVLADNSGLARAMTGPQGAATLLAARAARQIEAQAKTNAPVSTGGGTLRNRIEADVAPKVTGLKVESGVTANANYSLYVHEGVRGGKIIVPKQAKALRFVVGGRVVFAKSVKQGAQRPRPYLFNATKTVGARLGFITSRVP